MGSRSIAVRSVTVGCEVSRRLCRILHAVACSGCSNGLIGPPGRFMEKPSITNGGQAQPFFRLTVLAFVPFCETLMGPPTPNNKILGSTHEIRRRHGARLLAPHLSAVTRPADACRSASAL